MKYLALSLLLVSLPPLNAQDNGIDQSSDLSIMPTGETLLHWYGKTGRSYFIQVSDSSDHLVKWNWAPIIECGNDEEISHEVGGTADKGFFRLQYTDSPTPPGISLEDWDADGDGIKNWDELSIHHSSPLNSDTDGDSLPDDWEIAHNLNLLDNGTTDPDHGPDALFDSDGTTNAQAFSAGVQAAPGATLGDKDGDSIPDTEDADPASASVSWRKASKPAYAAVPIANWNSSTHGYPVSISNTGDILTNRAVWRNGTWIPINGYFNQSGGYGAAMPYQFNIEGRLHSCHLGPCQINSISDQGGIMGSGKIQIDPVIGPDTDPDTGAEIVHSASFAPTFAMIWSDPSALPQILDANAGAIFQGERHEQTGLIHRDGTIFLKQRRPEDIFVNNNWTIERRPIVANGGGVQTSPVYFAPSLTYPAAGGNIAFSSYISTSQGGLTAQSWIWPAAGIPQSLYTLATAAPGAPALNFQSTPTNIGTAPGGGACVNLSGQVLIARNGRYNQVASLQGATKISPQGSAIIPTPLGNPTLWFGGSTYPLKDCVANVAALGNTLTVSDINEQGTVIAIADVGTVNQKLVMLVPMEVRWEAISGFDNVDNHIDPWNKPIGGKRIFPDLKNPDDTEIRHKLELIVKTAPSFVGKTVFVKAFDVDDSTSEDFDLNQSGNAAVIDTNGKSGDDNLPDYLETPINGRFWTGTAWGNETSQATVDANGEAKFIFRVGMQPGDNYRVVASLIDESLYAGVQASNSAAARYLGPEEAQNGNAPASPLLTVWRRLWVENDSMEAIPTDSFGYKRNDLSADTSNPIINAATLNTAGTGTVFSISPISDATSFLNLENGRIVVQSIEHPVTGAGIVIDEHVVSVSGNYTSVPVGSAFRLYDDDDFGLDAAPLPRNDLVDELMKEFFRPSFIEVTDSDAFNTRKSVPFRKNDDLQSSTIVHPSNTVVNVSKDIVEKDALWVCQITSAYQPGFIEDGDPFDPDNEGPLCGGTRLFSNYEHSTVFVESCREDYEDSFRLTANTGNPVHAINARANLKKFITAQASHEMAHQPGNDEIGDVDHAESGLMRNGGADSGNPENLRFTPKTVSRFRSTENWSKKL